MTEKTTWKERRFRKIIASLDGKILNSDDLTGGGEPSVLFCLWGGLIGRLLDDDWRPTRAGLRFRRLIHPVFPLLGGKFLSNPQVIEKQEKFEELSAAFSTLKYETFARCCKCARESVSEEAWNACVTGIVKAYPRLDIEYEKSVIRKTHTAPEEAFAHLSQLIPSRENAFLIRTSEGDMWE